MTTNITERPAVSHGWLRRPEFDAPGMRAWERPDGSMFPAPIGRGDPVIVTVTETAEETGPIPPHP